MKVKELIKQLLDCDLEEDIYVNVPDYGGEFEFYFVDGLENKSCEYRNKPTLAVGKVKP